MNGPTELIEIGTRFGFFLCEASLYDRLRATHRVGSRSTLGLVLDGSSSPKRRARNLTINGASETHRQTLKTDVFQQRGLQLLVLFRRQRPAFFHLKPLASVIFPGANQYRQSVV